MRRYLESVPENERKGPIFKTTSGKRWNASVWADLMKKLRVKVGDPLVWFRDFRRGFISTRLRQGTQPKDVMQATGQKDIKTLMRYYAPAPDAKTKMVEAASEDLRPLSQATPGKYADLVSTKPPDVSKPTGPAPVEEEPQKRGDDENGTVLVPAA
jgi:hypothetical protein